MSTKFMSIIRVTKKYTVIFDFQGLKRLRGLFQMENLFENAAFANKKKRPPSRYGISLGWSRLSVVLIYSRLFLCDPRG